MPLLSPVRRPHTTVSDPTVSTRPISSAPKPVAGSDSSMFALRPSLDELSANIVPPLPNIASDLEKRQQERDARHRDVMEKIQRLIMRVKTQKLEQAQNKPVESAPPVPEPPVPTPDSVNPENPEPQVVESKTADPENAAPEKNELEPPQPESTPAPKSLSTTAEAEKPSPKQSLFDNDLKTVKVVDGAIDPVALADSLYAIEGELSVALEIYQQIDLKDLPVSERFWVTYQIASCHRQLEHIPEAQEMYRRVLGQEKAGWLRKKSMWWLDQIDARKELVLELKKQREIFERLKPLISPVTEEEQDEDAVTQTLPGI